MPIAATAAAEAASLRALIEAPTQDAGLAAGLAAGLSGYAWLAVFAVGSVLLAYACAGWLRSLDGGRIYLLREQWKRRLSAGRLAVRQRPPLRQEREERAHSERARLAGLSPYWTRSRFAQAQLLSALTLLALGLLSQGLLAVPGPGYPGGGAAGAAGSWLKPALAGLAGWTLPRLWLTAAIRGRRAKLLMEIAKLSHRLSVCVSERADMRELIIRAGRPLELLKPALQELAVMWGKDRSLAICRFRERVGVPEAFPLVNALEAISRADSHEIAKVLKEQTAGIETTLGAERDRQLENAPVWISFYVMVPFAVIVVLFLYPWLITISEQLMTSFEG
ncbi:hypothetical protein SAMN02799630_05367 [Paenibacillus sp. UNCCL117]|uniref:hypothetical protein n=1 Tax=unclassified Paenibacillus TaxID=185978 RepID=UPI000891D03B|nr:MULTISPECIES: hypothetical protein [unclassified Paenibacillus]SDE40751.1 hypothetical protein SAMN04488602_12736 [Paenibacillus sp. cl123]SFW65389.1 hypothetical protein SAMN02799630_05367 [Paenibacillus sp. UNCCL117]